MNLPPSISKAATLELIRQHRATTDEEQRSRLENEIVKGNLRFCAYQARRYAQQGVEFEDLVAVAAAALLDAVRRFDPAQSVHFAAYARRCIRRDLVVTIRRTASPIRLPREPRRGERETGRESVAAPKVFELDGMRGTARKVAARVNASDTEEGHVIQTSGVTFRPVEGHDMMTDDPTDGLLAQIDGERIATLIAALPDRDATIIRMRFGLDGMAPHDLAEIGAVLSVSKQRVQHLLDRALASLKDTLLAPKAAA